MLYGSMKESQLSSNDMNNIDNGIKLPDITPNAFDFLLKYIYGLNPSVSDDISVDLLYLSKKYLIKPIENACIDTLKCQFEKLQSADSILNVLNKLYCLSLNVS